MKTNSEVLKDATTTADLKAGGYMNQKQANKFLQMVFDSTSLIKACRTIILPSPKYEIDKIGVGMRLMRGMNETEDMSPYTKKPIFGKLELSAEKYALPFEFSEDMLEDNIEGKKIEDRIANLFATQMGLDTEDLGVNGDKVYSSSRPSTSLTATLDASDPVSINVTDVSGFPKTSEAGYLKINNELISYERIDPVTNTFLNCSRGEEGTAVTNHNEGTAVEWIRDSLLGVDDGWIKKMYEGNSHYVDLSGDIEKGQFFELHRALPKKYRRNKNLLRWVTSSTQKSKWDEYLTNRQTGAGDAVLTGKEFGPLGIPFMEVASFPEDIIALTYPKNFIYAVWRKLKVKKTDRAKESIMRDLVFYNMTTRIDFEIEELDAVAFGDGLHI